MNIVYFYELSTGFWINMGAGYLLALPVAPTLFDKIFSLIYTMICLFLAYTSRTKQK
jgi:hypothetical protein